MDLKYSVRKGLTFTETTFQLEKRKYNEKVSNNIKQTWQMALSKLEETV